MKILYLSCHSILEYDELKLFNELGYDWFSMGSYANPGNPADKKRPALDGKYNDHFIALEGRYSKDNIHPELIEPHDIIFVSHITDWVKSNWDKMKHKKVVWRSIGQSAANIEADVREYAAKGMKVVRYSPMERNIPNYAGENTIIRFYKDPKEFKDWNGNDNRVITFGQSIRKRGEHCHYDSFDQITTGLNRAVFGPDNDNIGEINMGQLSYEELKETLRNSRVYFYLGTQPASYTLGLIEAMMTGIPVVSIGPQLGNSIYQSNTFEVHQIIENGKSGFWSDDPFELRRSLDKLLNDHEFAKSIGEAGRKRAIELFGMDTIKNQWKRFLESL